MLLHGGLICIIFCLSLPNKSLEKINISQSIALMVPNVTMRVYLDNTKVDLGDQGQGHEVKNPNYFRKYCANSY